MLLIALVTSNSARSWNSFSPSRSMMRSKRAMRSVLQLLEQIGQPAGEGDLAQLLFGLRRGGTQVGLPAFHAAHEAALAEDHGAFAHGDLARDTDLAPKRYAILDHHGTGDGHVRADQAMPADARVVPDLYVIVQLGALPDTC